MEEQNQNINNTDEKIEKKSTSLKRIVFFGFIFLLVMVGTILVKVLRVDVKVENEKESVLPVATTKSQTPETKTMEPVTELIKDDTLIGSGQEVKNGDKAVVHYNGTLLNGTKFDSSYDRGAPFQFTLGAGEVIAGWDQGVLGMKVGGKRKLVIPANLGYGPVPMGSIPANSTLVFEVELVDIEK